MDIEQNDDDENRNSYKSLNMIFICFDSSMRILSVLGFSFAQINYGNLKRWVCYYIEENKRIYLNIFIIFEQGIK